MLHFVRYRGFTEKEIEFMNEYEFVHLLHPRQQSSPAERVAKEIDGEQCQCQRSLPELEGYMQSIIDAAAYDGSYGSDAFIIATLCQSCVEKLEMACDLSIDKIKSDIDVYDLFFMRFQQEYDREMLPKEVNDDREQEELQKRGAIAKSYVEELPNLTRALTVHAEELSYLENLIQVQESRAQAIYQQKENSYLEINALEMDSKSLQYDLENCARKLSLALEEVMHSNENLHLNLFEIDIDDRPLINGLRLAHRPKGNLKWKEINASWAEAVKLLLFCGGESCFLSYIAPYCSGVRKICLLALLVLNVD